MFVCQANLKIVTSFKEDVSRVQIHMLGSSFVTLWEGHLKGFQTKKLRSNSTGYITPVSNGAMTWVKQRPGTHYECASYMIRKTIKEKRRWQTCCGIVTVT